MLDWTWICTCNNTTELGQVSTLPSYWFVTNLNWPSINWPINQGGGICWLLAVGAIYRVQYLWSHCVTCLTKRASIRVRSLTTTKIG